MGDMKIVDNSQHGRIDAYENGMNGPDGYHHDHHWNHIRQDGTVSQAGTADRSAEREALARGLGSAALRGF
jgi:hypothetical protein